MSDVEKPASILTQQLELRYTYRMLNASAQNEDGVCQFSQTRAKNRLPGTIAISLERVVAISIHYYNAHNLLYTGRTFDKHQSRNSGEKQRKNVYFTIYVHPPTSCKSATRSQRLLKFLQDVEGTSRVSVLMQVLRSSQPLYNASTNNDGVSCQLTIYDTVDLRAP